MSRNFKHPMLGVAHLVCRMWSPSDKSKLGCTVYVRRKGKRVMCERKTVAIAERLGWRQSEYLCRRHAKTYTRHLVKALGEMTAHLESTK